MRGEWRRYNNSLLEDQENAVDSDASFDISVVNFEENGSRSPIPYVLPPGIQRETYYGATSLQQQNEQSMVLKVIDLEDGDARAAFKNVTMDMRNYKNIEMYISNYNKIIGVMWHPEREKNLINLYKLIDYFKK